MALAAVACGHFLVTLQPTVMGCSPSSSTSRNFTWNPLALKATSRPEMSQFFGAELSHRRLTGAADQRKFLRGIEAAKGADEMKQKQQAGAEETWSRVVKRGSDMVAESLKRLSRPTMAVMLSLLLTQGNPEMASAAGGGRVGGRVGGGSSFSSKSFSAPSRSYSGSSGGYSMPRQYIAPSPGFSYAVPYAAPSPFFGGGLYAAPAYGIGLGGGSIFFLVILGFIVLQAFYGFVSERSGLGGSLLTGAQKVSVLKLQVTYGRCCTCGPSFL